MGLFKKIVKKIRKPAAALLGGHMITGLVARVAPGALGIKSAGAKRLVATVQGSMAAVGGMALGSALMQHAKPSAGPAMSYEDWLAKVGVTKPLLTGGAPNGPTVIGTTDRVESGVQIPDQGNGQSRRPVRRRSRRCWSSHGRRYCYRE